LLSPPAFAASLIPSFGARGQPAPDPISFAGTDGAVHFSRSSEIAFSLGPSKTALLSACALALAGAVVRAAEEPVVIVVAPGSELSRVEAARAIVDPSGSPLLVGASERISLREGVDAVADATFSEAPASDLIVVLAGEHPAEAEQFLRARKRTARVIFFVGNSPLAGRLKSAGGGGALLLVGQLDALRALLDTRAAPGAAAADAPAPAPPPTTTPTAAPRERRGVFDSYFSSERAKATPSPTPTPGAGSRF
jgi:hypothetical protein